MHVDVAFFFFFFFPGGCPLLSAVFVDLHLYMTLGGEEYNVNLSMNTAV